MMKRQKQGFAFLLLFALIFGSLFAAIDTAHADTATTVEINPASIVIQPGSQKQLTALVKNENHEVMENQPLDWNSLNIDVADVDQSGLVTAISEGATTVVAACYNDSSIKAECHVKVRDSYSTNLVIISGANGLIVNTAKAYSNLTEGKSPPYEFGLKLFSSKDLDSAEGRARIQQAVQDADAILLQMIGTGHIKTLHDDIFKVSYENKWSTGDKPQIFIQDSSGLKPEAIVKDLTGLTVNTDPAVYQQLNTYIKNYVPLNCERMLLYLAVELVKKDVALLPPDSLTPIEFGSFVFHPAAQAEGAGTNEDTPGVFFNPDEYYQWYQNRAEYNPTAPWVGIVVRSTEYFSDDQALYLSTLQALEEKDTHVVLLYVPANDQERFDAIEEFLHRDGNKEFVDAIICPISFYFNKTLFLPEAEDPGKDYKKYTIKYFQNLNVPIMTPIYASDLEKWENNPAGAQDVIYYQIAQPDMEGRFLPVLMGGSVAQGKDPLTGAVITRKVAVPDRIERLAGQAASWAKLHNLANRDKKVAIIYYNHHGGKDDINASYLNVPRSLTEILKALKDNDYTVDTDSALSDNGQITEAKVFDAMFNKGRNVGGWAPGELQTFADQDGIIKLSKDEYLNWYNQLPGKLRDAVEAEWGEAPGEVMVEDGKIIIPGVMSGNIFFGPQPMRGWGEDVNKIIHSSTLPPTHQYLAFYYWLQHGYEADAVVYLGTHGTAEWLPGKAVGLSGEDWPDVLQGNMPDIYPYIVNNPGEGIQAKRRLYAALIAHLTADVANTELYGNLLELHNLVHEYDDAQANGASAEEIENIKIKIDTILLEDGMDLKVGYSADEPFEQQLEKCHNYLHDLEADVTPLGLHTFGISPQGEAFENMVTAIINFDPANRMALEGRIQALLANTGADEIDNLLLALNAGYIAPGVGADPVRNPDCLPMGRNLQSIDPFSIPTKGAWEIGKKCADELLAAYYDNYGSYPESMGVVLWDTETMRTQGHTFGMIMQLLGIEPVYDSKLYVKSYKVIPAEELGRPRIDVVITASGLCRDTFSCQLLLLDKAIRELAENSDDINNNYVKKQFEKMKKEYLADGKSIAEADFLAASRVFAPAPGTYGTGITDKMDATASWDQCEELVETYLSRVGYIYGTAKDGTAVYGQAAQDTFIKSLENVQSIVQVRDTIYGALDNDDFAMYYGGLLLASKWASGHDVDAYIANTRLGVNVQTFKQFLSQELDSRLLNPKFVEEMLKEGYAGSATLAEWFGNTFYIAVTTGAVSDQDWHNLAAMYVFNDDVRSQLNPHALQSMIGYAMEAARKGVWQASKEDLTQLSNTYVQSMADYGVVCCHHTCGNVVFNEWLAQYSTLDNDTLAQFRDTLAEATGKTVDIPTKKTSSSNKEEKPPDPVLKEEKPATKAEPPQIPEVKVEEPEEPVAQVVADNMTEKETENEPQPPAAGEKPQDEAVPAASTAGAVKPEAAAEEPQDAVSRAYELEKKQNTPMSTGTKAVSAIAILGVLGLVGLFFKGYLKNR